MVRCCGVQNTAEFSVDIIGQRYARKETGQRNGKHYSVFYLYYYAAVRCQPTVRFLTGVRWGLEGKSWVYKVRDLLQTCTGSKVGF